MFPKQKVIKVPPDVSTNLTVLRILNKSLDSRHSSSSHHVFITCLPHHALDQTMQRYRMQTITLSVTDVVRRHISETFTTAGYCATRLCNYIKEIKRSSAVAVYSYYCSQHKTTSEIISATDLLFAASINLLVLVSLMDRRPQSLRLTSSNCQERAEKHDKQSRSHALNGHRAGVRKFE